MYKDPAPSLKQGTCSARKYTVQSVPIQYPSKNRGKPVAMSGYLERVERAVRAVAAGRFVVVIDDEDRENEGDLILAASHATPDAIGFMVRHTSGLICAPMTGERLDELQLPLMVTDNADLHGTAFTVSVDAVGTGTGISAADRSMTLRTLADDSTTATDLNRPGHVFPLRYRPGGVLKRAGHTEAAIDLIELAGLPSVGVISELVNADGTVARADDLARFTSEHGLIMISVEDLVRYRRRGEQLVKRTAEARVPISGQQARAIVYESVLDGIEHVAVVFGDPAMESERGTLVRVHSECLTGDVLGSQRCDCGAQLERSLTAIADHGCGAVIYLRGHEGRGIGLAHKLRAYNLQDHLGLDTIDANLELGLPIDSREYGIGAQILSDLGIQRVRLMSNNPEKYRGLAGHDIEIVERVPVVIRQSDESRRYLQAKHGRMGHLLEHQSELHDQWPLAGTASMDV